MSNQINPAKKLPESDAVKSAARGKHLLRPTSQSR